MEILAVLRASTIQQELESQKAEMKKYCKAKGFNKIEWLEVKGASARKANAEYLQMLEDIKDTIIKKGIKNIAFWSLDRLGRIESYLMLMKEWFIKNKIQVYVNNPSLTLLNEDGSQNAGASIAWSVFASIVAFETEELMKKMRRTKDMNAKANKFNGGLDWKVGYVLDDNHYIVVDEEDEGYKLVQLIFNEYSTGKYSTISLFKELKSRGITKPNGKPLDSRFVQKILEDESYIGGHAKDVVTERTYTPIISKDIWNKCKEVANKNRKGDITKQTKHNYLAIKILKCPCCGGNLNANSKHYRCWKAFDTGGNVENACTNRTSANIQIVDGILWRIASMKHIDYLTDLKKTDVEEFKEKLKVNGQKIEEQKRLLDEIPNKKRKIQMGFENDVYTLAEYKNKLSMIDDNVKTIENTILSLKAKEKQFNDLINGGTDVDKETERLMDLMFGVYEEDDLIECKKIIDQHIKECIVKNVEDYQHICVVTKDGHDWNIIYKHKVRKGEKLFIVHSDGDIKPFDIEYIEYKDNKIKKSWK